MKRDYSLFNQEQSFYKKQYKSYLVGRLFCHESFILADTYIIYEELNI